MCIDTLVSSRKDYRKPISLMFNCIINIHCSEWIIDKNHIIWTNIKFYEYLFWISKFVHLWQILKFFCFPHCWVHKFAAIYKNKKINIKFVLLTAFVAASQAMRLAYEGLPSQTGNYSPRPDEYWFPPSRPDLHLGLHRWTSIFEQNARWLRRLLPVHHQRQRTRKGWWTDPLVSIKVKRETFNH